MAIDWGKEIISRDGRVPYILSTQGPTEKTRIIGYFLDDRIVRVWDEYGGSWRAESQAGSLANDLIQKPAEPVVRWVNVYQNPGEEYYVSAPYEREQAARDHAAVTISPLGDRISPCIATVRIEFVPGDGK